MRSLTWLLFSCTLLSIASAVQMDLIGKRVRRDDAGQFGNGSHALSNIADLNYQTNITVGGRQFSVLIDTGR
jgi:hypothetical protein